MGGIKIVPQSMVHFHELRSLRGFRKFQNACPHAYDEWYIAENSLFVFDCPNASPRKRTLSSLILRLVFLLNLCPSVYRIQKNAVLPMLIGFSKKTRKLVSISAVCPQSPVFWVVVFC